MSMKHKAQLTGVDTTVRVARVIDEHRKSTGAERQQAFQDAQAEGLSTFESPRTHLSFEVTKGTATSISTWLRETEFGDFNDNYEAFTVSQYQIENGQLEQGLAGLCLLREHIVQSKEIKSVSHLLPVINELLILRSACRKVSDGLCKR